MTKVKDIAFLESLLLKFITETDHLLAMLQWLVNKLVEVEVAQKVNAEKGQHTTERTTYRCGTRVRRFDTRLGTLYMVILKLHKSGYIPLSTSVKSFRFLSVHGFHFFPVSRTIFPGSQRLPFLNDLSFDKNIL